MNKTVVRGNSEAEETVNYKSYLKGLDRTRTTGSLKSIHRKNSFGSLKPPFQGSTKLELDSVGEEGTAQIIRSPIVKRGKSSHQSLDLTPTTSHQSQNSESFITSLQSTQQELKYLRQENKLLKSQIKLVQNSLNDFKYKLESALAASETLRESNTQLLMENKKLRQEVDQLMTVINLYDNESCRSSHVFLQDDLEAKILSLDKEKEEKYEMYQGTLMKLISYINEFIASEEWVLSLASSPYAKRELMDNEEVIRIRLERLQSELCACHLQVKTERFIDKSYFTSISSSVIPSPLLSPKHTLKSSDLTHLKFSN